ncbi:hypothetical protein STTU_3326 [Streptomyces sp. Tu6071]|nr:hypothetical protein STTU_3326 [Streptomyces sp. Tu6071]
MVLALEGPEYAQVGTGRLVEGVDGAEGVPVQLAPLGERPVRRPARPPVHGLGRGVDRVRGLDHVLVGKEHDALERTASRAFRVGQVLGEAAVRVR